MAIILAVFSWPRGARSIRAQILSLREREFIDIAELSGEGTFEILFKEIFPNMIPYVATSLVISVTSAMLAEVGLELIGIGPSGVYTLGIMFWHAQQWAASFNGWWWWHVPAIISLVTIFVGLYLMSLGLDEISNPRLKKT
jgi:peptide/nickel transport system permease protein